MPSQELPSIQQQIDNSSSTFAVLESSHHPLPDESAVLFWQLRHWPMAIQDELVAARERIESYRNHYKQQLYADQQQLQEDLQRAQVCFMPNASLRASHSRLLCTPCTVA